MKLRKVLAELARAIADEAERNPDFERRVTMALGLTDEPARRDTRAQVEGQGDNRPKNRRPPAVLDPVELARSGEQALRARLLNMTVEQLKDIVADYGMDPGKLVTKWKTADRIIERIVEISLARSQKGDAFRAE
jgi:hypothetical protein